MKKNRGNTTSEILKKTSSLEHKIYTVDFKTGEYSVEGATHPMTIQNNEAKVIQMFKSKRKTVTLGSGMGSTLNEQDSYRERIADIGERTSQPYFIKNHQFSVGQFCQDNYLAIIGILLLAYFMSSNAFARNPQGEFSALVEHNKVRSDFKSKKEMMKFVKNEEKKYNKKQGKGK